MISVSNKVWSERQIEERLIDKISQDNKLSPLLAKLIASRNFSDDEIYSIKNKINLKNYFINKRDFMDLSKVNMKNAIDAKILDKKLSGLKWITALYPDDPKKEILQLQESINIINKVSIISKNMLFIFCIKTKDNVLI